jgi:hypothetical protein
MQYMLAIMYDPTLPPDGISSRQKLHAALAEEMRAAGHSRGGGGLAPVESYRKRIVIDNGEFVVSDGPFAETHEVLGGYFLVECSEAEAIAWAKRIEHDARSWVEIRAAWVDPKG